MSIVVRTAPISENPEMVNYAYDKGDELRSAVRGE